MDLPPLGPELVANLQIEADARHAHHEAGHAVAVVARGGRLVGVFLGTADWSTVDDSTDTPGGTMHRTTPDDWAFVTYAGPWAQAMWQSELAVDADDYDFPEALDVAWESGSDDDANKYETLIADMERFDRRHTWTKGWLAELTPLWPAVREVAQMLLDGKQVTHEAVLDAVQRCG